MVTDNLFDINQLRALTPVETERYAQTFARERLAAAVRAILQPAAAREGRPPGDERS
jgi:hypothetical protein